MTILDFHIIIRIRKTADAMTCATSTIRNIIISNASDTNKNIIMSSFKSSRDIQKKEGGPDSCFG